MATLTRMLLTKTHTCYASIHSYCNSSNANSTSNAKSLLSSNKSLSLLSSNKSPNISSLPNKTLFPSNSICRRRFVHSLSSKRPSFSLLELKSYLKARHVDYEESHSNLRLLVPTRVLLPHHGVGWTRWSEIEKSVIDVFVDKNTGHFVCPDLAMAAGSAVLKDIIDAWKLQPEGGEDNARLDREQSNEHLCLRLALDPELHELFHHGCVSPLDLDLSVFRRFSRRLRLPPQLRPQDLAKLEARVHLAEDDSPKLYFPVRYANAPFDLIGLRRVSIDQNEDIVEETLPSAQVTFDELDQNHGFHEKSTHNVHPLQPFPLGLNIVARNPSAKCLTLTASVLDHLALSRVTNLPCVTLAAGWSTLNPLHLAFFERFEKLVLWFPSDSAAAFDAARAFARKLGEKRCAIVQRDCPAPLEALRAKKDLMHIFKSGQRPCFHEYITTFDSLRDDVYLEMAHCDEVSGVKWKRFDALNDLIRGFRRGEVTIFSGKTGTGKTTFISEYSVDLCMQGVNTLWGSFEVRNTRLAKMQLKQFSAIDLEANIELFDQWADKFQKLNMFYLTFHGAQEVTKVLDAMGHAVYMYDIGHVIIDNVQFMMGMAHADKFYAQDLVLQRFRKFATLHNVHLTLVVHPRKEDSERLTANSVSGGAKATQEADNVLLLQEEEVNLKLKRKFVQVVKNRFSGDLGSVPLFFNRSTCTFSKKIFMRDKREGKKRNVPKTDDKDKESDNEVMTPQRDILLPPDRL